MNASTAAERLSSLPVGRDLPGEVIRVYGDLRGRLDGDLVALGGVGNVVLTVEEGGVLRRFDLYNGFQLSAIPLSELEAGWVFSPDGRLLASGGLEMGVWNTHDGVQSHAFATPAWVTSLAFNSDASLIASGHDDNLVRIWSVAEGKLLWTLTRHQAEVCAVAFSDDGLRLATAGEDRRVVVWNVETGVSECELVGHTDRVEALAWSHSGDLLASASWDTSIRLWDAGTGELKALLNGQGERVHCVAFLPDDSALVGGDSDGVVRIWDHANLKVVKSLDGHLADVRHLRLFADGSKVVSGGTDRTLLFWDVEADTVVPEPSTASTAIVGAELVSQDELVVVHEGGVISVWDFETALRLEGPECPPVGVVAADSGGSWAAGHEDGSITWYPIGEDRGEVHWQAHGAPVHRLAIQPSGRLIASATGADGTVHLWNAETGEPVLVMPLAVERGGVEALAFHPKRDLLAVGGVDWLNVGDRDGSIAIWNWRTRSKEIVLPGGALSLAFSKDGGLLAAIGSDGAVLIWDSLAASMIEEIAFHGSLATAIAFDPTGRYFAVACDDNGLRVWLVDGWKFLAAIDLETLPRSLVFAPEGQSIIVGNSNACCYLIDLSDLPETD